MTMEVSDQVESFMQGLVERNPGELEFHQAVREFVETLMPFVVQHPKYQKAHILHRMTEPDRIVSFRVVASSCSPEKLFLVRATSPPPIAGSLRSSSQKARSPGRVVIEDSGFRHPALKTD